MEKLLDGLTGKAKLECEEAHRLYMCAMNGKLKCHILLLPRSLFVTVGVNEHRFQIFGSL